MRLTLANCKLFYNKAEKQVKNDFPNYNFFERAEAIDKILDRKHGEFDNAVISPYNNLAFAFSSLSYRTSAGIIA